MAGDKFDLEIETETMPGVTSRATVTRECVQSLGELLIQLANDPTRTGVLILMHEDGDVSLASMGQSVEVGHA